MLFANTGANETPATEVASVESMETIGATDELIEMAGPILRRTRRNLAEFYRFFVFVHCRLRR
jgi:hypothetical protein